MHRLLVAVQVTDPDAELPNLARYAWWSLEHGVPLTFVLPDAAAEPQLLLPVTASPRRRRRRQPALR